MKVKAKKLGFFGGKYRKVGDTFDCPTDQEFSNSWMEKVKKGKQKKIEEPKDGYIPLEIPSLMVKDDDGTIERADTAPLV